jgi:hypothetical protein
MEKMVAKFVEKSDNIKISAKEHKVSATYVSIKASCPTTCQLRNEGSCYAMGGPIAIHLRNLDANSENHNANSAAEQEAFLIKNSFGGKQVPQDGYKGGRDLRLHVFGDATTPQAANALGEAANDWKARKGGSVWTYTHAWKTVRRSDWGNSVSVLASIDKIEDAKEVMEQGYAPALVVDVFPQNKAFIKNDIRWIPCPEQTNGINCTKCRLCFNADRLKENKSAILFAAHGSGTNKIKKRMLNVVNNEK